MLCFLTIVFLKAPLNSKQLWVPPQSSSKIRPANTPPQNHVALDIYVQIYIQMIVDGGNGGDDDNDNNDDDVVVVVAVYWKQLFSHNIFWFWFPFPSSSHTSPPIQIHMLSESH